MAEAFRDGNRVPTLLAVSDADGETTRPVHADPSNHAIKVTNGTGGSDLSDDIGNRDDNRVVVAMGVSSADGVTPVEIYVDDATNFLKIKTT